MQISINANRCEPSPMRKFHPLAVEAQKNGKTIYHLNIGQPDLETPTAYYETIRNFDHKTLAYDASPGNPLLIDAIRKYYAGLGVSLEPNDVLITTGGSEALLLTCLSILDPYTEVIIPEPYYPNYSTFVHAAGGVIRDTAYGADITLRAAFPAGGAERFSARLTELSAGGLEMTVAGEEFLPGSREAAK